MGRRFYRTGQFARKASVSVRTLRYYDKVGLLSPGQRTEAGYRLYTDEDLERLQQILALKFLGFTLEEVTACLRTGPQGLRAALAAQRAMLKEKRAQLDTIIRAVEETEKVIQAGRGTWESIVHVLEALQMQQKDEWQRKYFTPEQRRQVDELIDTSYSDTARQQLAARGEWTEEDQQRIDAQYARLGGELKRLVAKGADPASNEAQAVAQLQRELIAQFTQGDPAVVAGLRNFWQNVNALPADQRPVRLPYGPEEAAFLRQAMAIHDQQPKEES